jgi:Ni/Fe-hydrogenase b-type cytochrome subunit
MSGPKPKPATRRERGFSLAHKLPPPSGKYHWVYLWEWPIRVMHWIAVFCVLALVVTGLYIGMPYFVVGGDTANHYLMGRVRFVHFATASVLIATAVVRFYWLFAGNKFERLPALFPVKSRDWVNMWRQVKFYLMIQPEKAPHYLGHNPMQQLSYTGIYLAALVMVVSGFAMYGQSNPGGAVHSPCAHLDLPRLHPDPRLPGHPGGPPGAHWGDLLDHQRRPVRSRRRGVHRCRRSLIPRPGRRWSSASAIPSWAMTGWASRYWSGCGASGRYRRTSSWWTAAPGG